MSPLNVAPPRNSILPRVTIRRPGPGGYVGELYVLLPCQLQLALGSMTHRTCTPSEPLALTITSECLPLLVVRNFPDRIAYWGRFTGRYSIRISPTIARVRSRTVASARTHIS